MSSRSVAALAILAALIVPLARGASPGPRGGDSARSESPTSTAGAAWRDDGPVDPQLLADHIIYTALFRDLGLLPVGWHDGSPAAWTSRECVDMRPAPGWPVADRASVESAHRARPAAGACCRPKPDGFIECLHATQDRCESNGGVYEGDGTTCASHPCPQPAHGACCLTSSTGETGCTDSTASVCDNLEGAFQGVGSSCAAGSCAPQPPTGACCTTSGTGTPVCSQATSAECATAGGTYRGDDTVCAADTCAPPPTGPCCTGPDFATCLEITGAECSAQGGIPLGTNFDCVEGACSQGTCCLPNPSFPFGYSCTVLFSVHCTAFGGTFLGTGTPCSECDLIAPGACCLGFGDCRMLFRDECLALGGGWHGAGYQCFTPLCG